MRNKKLSAVALSALTALTMTSALPMTANAENPIVQTSFTPDPAPVVIGDELYVFTGCDRDGNNDFYYMTGWQCFSTKDMQNWTDHGRILEDESFSWCNKNDAWASQCIERNGKFYFYFTTTNKSGGGRAIGVAVADKPEGPYQDVLGKPLCGPNWDYIDPTVMIDDDGQAWLMFGNPKCYYVKLKDDMVTLDGQIKNFDMNSASFGNGKNGSAYGEGPWITKHGDLYYLVYAGFVGSDGGESMAYSTGPSVTGPWTYRGQIMKPLNCFTTHGGIVDFKDHSYFFYHKNGLKGGGTFNRSACVEEFSYNPDGTIPMLTATSEGPKQLESLNPFERVEAETICNSSGIKTEKCSEGGVDIANIEKGDYVKVSGVDFGDGAEKFTASVASATEGGTIELHTGSPSGPVIGACQVKGTGGWQTWEEVSCDVKVSGKQDLYLVFNGGSGFLMNVDWWKFTGAGSSETITTATTTTKPVTTTSTTTTKTATENITPVADTGDYIFNDTFESGDNDWTTRGSAKVSSSSSNANGGSKSLYCNGREASWNGALKELDSTFKAGESYSFSANVLSDGGKDGDVYYFTMEYEDANGDFHYEKIAKAKPMKGEWVQLANSNFTIPEDAVKNIHIYIETEKSTASFYVDDVKAAKAGTVIEGAKGRQFILGDLNGDGDVNVFDVILGRKYIIKGFKDGDKMKNLADVDQSTEFEINDLVLLQNFVKGKEIEFPDNSPEPPKSSFNYNANLQVKDAPANYLDTCSQAGKITKETYNGIRGTKSLNVYTPYNYDPSKKYNIFYLMHGGGENENTIFSKDVKLNNILDHMIMNGELEPMIVVTPTFNGTGSEAGNFWDEFKKSVVPFVEGKYSTYAESTSLSDLQASRMHRAYGGFSMGGLSTWCVADHDMDIVGYFMPLSGNNWEGMSKLTAEIDSLGFSQRDYFIMACTGDGDIAYSNMKPEMEDLKNNKKKYFTYTSDFSQGNLYWLVAPGRVHWWGHVRHYIYDALPYFFHEGQ